MGAAMIHADRWLSRQMWQS